MYYKYKVTYWSIVDEEDKRDKGFVFANNYGEAAMNVLNDYGTDKVEDIYLQELDTSATISEDEIKDVL